MHPIFLNNCMNRLYTFGCSYTYFYWPTWADFLSLNYDYHENWGYAGLGNRAIAERLAECHARNLIDKDDTVIVQWSTHLRYDWHNPTPIKGNYGWQTNGNVYNRWNQDIFTSQLLKTFCTESSLILHTLNNIILVAGILDSIGCNWRFTSMGDIRHLGNDLDYSTRRYETGVEKEGFLTEEDLSNFELYEKYPHYELYNDIIWKKYYNKWVKPINSTAQEHYNDYWQFQAAHDPEPWIEPHPSPVQHYKWIAQELAKSLDLKLVNSDQLMTTIIEKKKNSMDAMELERWFCENSLPQLTQWPPRMLGF
jgi:hypothetical protein